MASREEKTVQEKKTNMSKQIDKQEKKQVKQTPAVHSKPRPWYCFRCGEDGHIVFSCSNPPNSTLVQAKKRELREKQKAWDMQNGAAGMQDLNE